MSQRLSLSYSVSPLKIVMKAISVAQRKLVRRHVRSRDYKSSTYGPVNASLGGILRHILVSIPINDLTPMASQIAQIADNHLGHRFDLLGSGWVHVYHGMRCRGLEGHSYDLGSVATPDHQGGWLAGRMNRANQSEAQRVWRLVEEDYIAIDWHLDFKSGYRWQEDTWFGDVKRARLPGVDIKVPWELGRMQHLPQLSLAYVLATAGNVGFEPPRRYSQEFRNQVLDFISTNPPQFGVNWSSTMDVAIRIATWLVAYDLFRAHGVEFDADFERELARSVHSHGTHIMNNLEWEPELRGNHYLANITGLLFCAAYLPRTRLTDAWLAFSTQQLVKEVRFQFNEDGTNFEASTCYHALSTQMAAYATALVLGLSDDKREALVEYDYRAMRARRLLRSGPTELYRTPGRETRSPFPPWYSLRLWKMGEFLSNITKPNGCIPQIGDNDSGQFLKLCPPVHRLTVSEAKRRYANLKGYDNLPDDAPYWAENQLDRIPVAKAINALFESRDQGDGQVAASLEERVVGALAGGSCLSVEQSDRAIYAKDDMCVGIEHDWKSLGTTAALARGRRVTVIRVQGTDLLRALQLLAYPDFGLYLFRSERLYLAVRCGPIGQRGHGGHAHNDQLAIELNVDGEDWIADPGTYLYTPLPEFRNRYRGVSAHFAPRMADREPGRLDLGLFRLGDQAKGKCLYFGRTGFAGVHYGYGAPTFRLVELKTHEIRITDYAPGLQLAPPATDMITYGTRMESSVSYSPGYGWRCSGRLPT